MCCVLCVGVDGMGFREEASWGKKKRGGFVEEGLGALQQASVKGLFLYVFSCGLALCACRGSGHCYRRASKLGGEIGEAANTEKSRARATATSPHTNIWSFPFVDKKAAF